MKTVLLTGATGFLGSNLAKKLLEKNYSVVILKRSFSDLSRIQQIFSKIITYDVDKISLDKVFEENKIDIIVHCATNYGRRNQEIKRLIDTNISFPLQLFEFAVKNSVSLFINTDSMLPKFVSPYSLSKKQFAEWLEFYSKKNNALKIVDLRIEHMYGLGDDNTKFTSWIIEQLKENVKEIDLTEGLQKRDFIYISDIVDAFLCAIENKTKLPNHISLDVATGRQTSVKEFVNKVFLEVSKYINLNTKLNFGKIPYREGDNMEVEENIQPLLNLGWKPQVSLEQGLAMYIKGVFNETN